MDKLQQLKQWNLMFQIYFQTKKQKGYSLIEAIIYIAIASAMFSAVIYASVQVLAQYKRAKNISNVEKTAIIAMDRMIREIRSATSVDTSGSCLFDPPFADGCDPELGILKLNKVVSGASQTVRFYVTDGRIMVEENGTETGPLTSSRVMIDYLKFRRSATSTGEALRVELSILPNGENEIPKNFYNTAVLRGSYQ